jgi:hypothetical protein
VLQALGTIWFRFLQKKYKKKFHDCVPLTNFSTCTVQVYISRIYESTFLLSFLGKILRVIRLDVSVYNVTLQTSFKPILLGGRGGGVNSLVEVAVNSKELLRLLSPLRPRIRPLSRYVLEMKNREMSLHSNRYTGIWSTENKVVSNQHVRSSSK